MKYLFQSILLISTLLLSSNAISQTNSIIIDTRTNEVKYLLNSNINIDIQSNFIVTDLFIIGDLDSSNAELITNIDSLLIPSDFRVNKYLYEGGEFILNPNYSEAPPDTTDTDEVIDVKSRIQTDTVQLLLDLNNIIFYVFEATDSLVVTEDNVITEHFIIKDFNQSNSQLISDVSTILLPDNYVPGKFQYTNGEIIALQ